MALSGVYISCIFEMIMAAVLLLISLHSYSIFKVLDESKYKWFSYSFFVMALAFVGRTLMNFVIYTNEIRRKVSGAVIVAFQHTSASNMLWHYGLFTYRLLMIMGLIGIFLIITKSKERKLWILVFYLAFLTSLASMSVPYVFNLSSAVILGLITLQFCRNYISKPKSASFGVLLAFLIIFLSHVTFIFNDINHYLYVVGEFVQLIGYMFLLAVYVSILRR